MNYIFKNPTIVTRELRVYLVFFYPHDSPLRASCKAVGLNLALHESQADILISTTLILVNPMTNNKRLHKGKK